MSFIKKKRAKFFHKSDELNFEINLRPKKDLYFYLTFIVFFYVSIYIFSTLAYSFFQIFKSDPFYLDNKNLLISTPYSTVGQTVTLLSESGFKGKFIDLIFFLQFLL